MSAESSSVYRNLGVSPSKEDVHQAIQNLDQGLYPGAFCKILPDVVSGDENHCYSLHADTAGTKSVLAYLYWRETGDASVFRGIAQDASVMNLDDLACVGATTNFVLSNTISRNAHRIDQEVIQEIIEGYSQLAEKMQPFGIEILLAGGETADEGDLVSTVIAGCTVGVRFPRDQVIDARNIRPGDVIVGLSSAGKASYETTENSGIGSNGLTAARHVLLKNTYAQKYPEAFSSTLEPEKVFLGPYLLADVLAGSSLSVGQALLSPTRTYLPVVKDILEKIGSQNIHGLIHNSGGGLTKCLKFGQGCHYIKDNLLPIPPLFAAIADTGNISAKEMNEVFNMGQRLEVYLEKKYADQVITCAKSFEIDAQIIGRVEPSDGQNKVTVERQGEVFAYTFD